ncbi:MAG: response regulator transcription factor [Rubrivivax sp.]|nr:MAG: response regulator transcription factor [Rubrivivax sp.]
MTHTRITVGWTDHRPGPDLLLEGALSDYLLGAGFELVSCLVDCDLEVVCAESTQQLQSHPWGQMATRAAQARQRPLMVLLNHATSSERAALLEQGADDCMAGTTIVYRELAARLQALWRRHHVRIETTSAAAPSPMASEWIKFGPWQLDTRRHHLIDRAFQEVPLTRPEYRLLLTFLSMPSQVFTHEQLLDAARARGLDAVDRSLDALVARLAQKLGDDPERPTFIQPVRGQGYVFNAVPPLQLC